MTTDSVPNGYPTRSGGQTAQVVAVALSSLALLTSFISVGIVFFTPPAGGGATPARQATVSAPARNNSGQALDAQLESTKQQLASLERQYASLEQQLAGIRERMAGVPQISQEVSSIRERMAGLLEIPEQVSGLRTTVDDVRDAVGSVLDGHVKLEYSNGTGRLVVRGTSSGGNAELVARTYDAPGGRRPILEMKSGNTEVLELGAGSDGGAFAYFRSSDNQQRVYIGTAADSRSGLVRTYYGDNREIFYAGTNRDYTHGRVSLYDVDSAGTVVLVADANPYINLCRSSSSCTRISGGADVAEWFPAERAIAPGYVVVAREREGGPVAAVSDRPGDHRVLGIVSGAGSATPAITIGESHESSVPVALAGTVFAYADAEAAPIRVGDLLVSAATPGHVMSAGPEAPPGTVVGKALEALPAGRGLIRVWVSRN